MTSLMVYNIVKIHKSESLRFPTPHEKIIDD